MESNAPFKCSFTPSVVASQTLVMRRRDACEANFAENADSEALDQSEQAFLVMVELGRSAAKKIKLTHTNQVRRRDVITL